MDIEQKANEVWNAGWDYDAVASYASEHECSVEQAVEQIWQLLQERGKE